ncbi:oxygen-insensitive NADPH nitroreductase [Bacillus aquiflavi]|uniref:Oxygen-insensitive NADPH nitroreductase n=1 Tax=Bacillus aquiflavi TaxID=2672567 RepID=A0A6B3VWR7_9BACI|nr:oxygen-insensitive NADPH nitroreductase [Bacillus aquiflavi]MBA4535570.1 oxygen-insensitive NADPH nitroreductase [Bacillus aquiflavi]NEY79946.1 oxygen-insensitive NADPH nitroreductase [Bacillus aquiflavi]UAC49943.1 oxygen-insensitive NADPH nitroreductase [Bacillus aquiflavi]
MNKVIETILNHRSVRKFTNEQLTEEQIHTIVACAQAASTSSFVQAYSIIGVTDQEIKKQLVEISGGQAYVEENGHFFIFCADLYRHELIGKMENRNVIPTIESTEKFMVALIDAALAAQNAAIAAESMGLGICYIGGIRNYLEEVSKLLKIPKRVIPLFGMSVGYPAKETAKKPRLPLEHIYHTNEYERDIKVSESQLQEYNQTISVYYKERTNGKRSDTWTGQIANMLEKSTRTYMKEYVEKQKMNLR